MADFELMPPLQPETPNQGKGLFLTMGAFVLVFLVVQHFAPTPPPAAPAPLVSAPSVPAASVPAPAVAVAFPVRTAALKGGSLEVQVTNAGAGICGLSCRKDAAASVLYDATLYTASSDLPPLLATAVSGEWRAGWDLATSPDGRSVRFTRTLPGGISLAKTLKIPETGYLITGELEIVNGGQAPVTLGLETLVPGPSDGSVTARIPQQVDYFLRAPTGELIHKSPESGPGIVKKHHRDPEPDPDDATKTLPASPWSPKDPWPARWSGMSSAYFSALVDLEGAGLSAWRVPATDHAVAVLSKSLTVAPGGREALSFRAFVGPKQKGILAAVDPILPEVLNLGPIDSAIQSSLAFLHGLAGNYGLAIILLTLLVRGAIHPLNRVAQSSMMTSAEKMKRLQPRLDEMKKRLKNNPEKLFKEQGRIMKEEGMSPFSALGGCLPILLQMPVLWALYKVLQGSVELRGAAFGAWIHDLAKEDAVMSGIPLLHTLNPLPLLLIGVMLFQMWKAPKPADPQMAQQQKMMMVIMPVMFGWMMYHLPAGITLYWLTSTTFSIGEQWYIRRRLVAKGVISAPAKA